MLYKLHYRNSSPSSVFANFCTSAPKPTADLALRWMVYVVPIARFLTISDVEVVVTSLPLPPTDELTSTVTVYPRIGRSLKGGLHCTDREDRPPITVGVMAKEASGTEAGTDQRRDQKLAENRKLCTSEDSSMHSP